MFKNVLAKLLVAAMIMTSVITVAPSTTAAAASKPTISKTAQNILVGKSYDLNVNNNIAGSTSKWSTSNAKVATVSKAGVVTGKGQGNAVITCTITKNKTTYKVNCKVAIRKAATSVKITNKVKALNAGQKYDLNRTVTPASSKDLVSWTSSDKSIAAPDSNGKFTAKKAGTVTITAKSLSGKTDKVTIKVVDAAGTVATQAELDSLLGSGASKVTIATSGAVAFTIAAGNYKQDLVVDAPNADVTNNGVFKSITIKQIKSTTWTENASGNAFVVLAPKARIIISKGAKAAITVDAASDLALVNNGTISAVVVNAAAKLNISGTSTALIPFTANAANASIATSVPLALTCNQKVALNVLPGAGATTVTAASQTAVPTVTGITGIKVSVGNTTQTPPADTNNGGTVGGGSSSSGGSSSDLKKKVVTKNSEGKFVLPTDYNKLSKVEVNYGALTYKVDGSMLSTLIGFLSDDSKTITTWKNTTDTTKTYSGQKVTVTGEKGSATKTVTFSAGAIGNKSYKVKVNDDNSVTINGKYTLSKSDSNTLIFKDAPSDLSFTVYY